jgi:hypothetical protein
MLKHHQLHTLPPSTCLMIHSSALTSFSMSSGLVVDPYRLTTLPSFPTRNLVKFLQSALCRFCQSTMLLHNQEGCNGLNDMRWKHEYRRCQNPSHHLMSAVRKPPCSFFRCCQTSEAASPLTSTLSNSWKLAPV